MNELILIYFWVWFSFVSFFVCFCFEKWSRERISFHHEIFMLYNNEAHRMVGVSLIIVEGLQLTLHGRELRLPGGITHHIVRMGADGALTCGAGEISEVPVNVELDGDDASGGRNDELGGSPAAAAVRSPSDRGETPGIRVGVPPVDADRAGGKCKYDSIYCVSFLSFINTD